MAIQNRRGAYVDLNPAKAVPGELLVVQSGDPNTTDGKAVYMTFASGDIKLLATKSDVETLVADATDEIVQDLEDTVEGYADRAETAATNAEGLVNGAEAAIAAKGAEQVAAVQAQGAQTIASIPEDYTELSGDVEDLKSALDTEYNYIESIIGNEFNIATNVFIEGCGTEYLDTTYMLNSPFVFFEDAHGVIITALRMNVLNSGTLSVGYVTSRPQSGDLYNADNVVFTNELNVSAVGVQTVKLPNPFVLPDNAALIIGNKTDTINWGYNTNCLSKGFLYAVYSTGKYSSSPNNLGVDVIGLPLAGYSSVLDYCMWKRPFIDSVFDPLFTECIFYDSYNVNNSTISGLTTAPFIAASHGPGFITSIKLNIHTVGTLSIGSIKSSDVILQGTFDFSKINIHETLEFNTLGEQTKELSVPMKLNSDEYIVLCVRTDTAKFYYGSYGTDLGFYYIDGTTTNRSVTGLGITFYGLESNANSGKDSFYYGKALSILGDSISTFSGYIPEGNATYYPSGTVQAVSDTWWYKLYTALGMELDTNNSWSGSRVTTTGGDTSAGCMTRCQNLGTPDVIIVWMGINDFNNEVQLGTYDGTTALPSVTTTFREAYAIMLNKILTEYQTAEVWVCTLPQCERNAETGFPEINGNGVALAEFNKAILELANAFGVKVLDHNKSGLTYQNMPTFNPDNLHPNKYGHSLVANNDIRQMDGVVSKRYPIS